MTNDEVGNEPAYDVHPLDRDYSTPLADDPSATTTSFDPKFRRFGIIGFAAGFVTLFVAAVMLSNAQGSSMLEGFGSSLHRFAMILILVGGVLIIIAYQLPRFYNRVRDRRRDIRFGAKRPMAVLLFWNLVAFVAISGAVELIPSNRPSLVSSLLLRAGFTFFCAFIATCAIWHRGVIRAYGIGVFVALVVNVYSGAFMLFNGGYYGRERTLYMQGSLAVVLLSGLICACYVGWLESARARHAEQKEDK